MLDHEHIDASTPTQLLHQQSQPKSKKKKGQFLKLSTPNKFLYFEPKSLNPTEPNIAGYGNKNVSHVLKWTKVLDHLNSIH